MSIIGRRVLHVHRQSVDYPREYREAHHGVVVGVGHGVNACISVRFAYDPDHIAIVPPQDLALVEEWPRPGCQLSEYLAQHQDNL